MYYLKTEASFDAAHFLKDYVGKCHNLHGHRWRVIVEVKSNSLQTNGQLRGMVVDFGDVKKMVKDLVDEFDHTFIYEDGSLKEKTISCLLEEGFTLRKVDFRPTAENFSKYFYDELIKKIDVYSVTVYETPNNGARYTNE